MDRRDTRDEATGGRARQGSAASRVFVVVAIAVTALVLLIAVLLVLDAQRSARTEAEEVTRAVANSLAAIPAVAEALTSDSPSDLQPFAESVMDDAGVDFVTIMTPDGIRVTHRDPDEIGRAYLGTIPEEPRAVTEEFTGTLGPSVRTIAPVLGTEGDLVGWVSVGVTVGSIASDIVPRLPGVLAIAGAVLAAGFVGAYLAQRTTRRVAGDLPPGTIRDAVSSYESVRTLGEALRAQTHEHGNRMHTAVSLLELGRTREAIDILTETSRQSQALVDQVAARRDGDPTVGALLLGKAAQARERGVEWTAEIAEDAPRSALSPVDAVSVVGNLIDNALDAAASGAEPRWVRVAFTPTGDRMLRIEVSDSGAGVPPELAERVFEHGFSTKPAGADGRGVGLALVRSIVESAGGSIDHDGYPTVFTVVLPARRP